MKFLFRRILVPLFVAALLALGTLWSVARLALTDLDRIIAAGAVGQAADDPLPGYKSWGLFLAAQIFPLRQPGGEVAAGRTFRDCADCPEMVEIAAGFFLIGSPLSEVDRYRHIFDRRPIRHQLKFWNREGPRRLVRISKPFALSAHEITFAAWERAQRDPDWERITGRPARIIAFGEPDYLTRPATRIDQNDARAFAVWMSATTGQHYRLPSEAEWEYAARAGTATRYPWGNDIGTDRAACDGCSTIWPEWRVGPVGQHAPNGFGLYDMIGNGWEWVEDCFAQGHPASISDGSASKDGDCEFGAFKGGSTFSRPWQNRAAMRVGPHNYNADEGSVIRLLRELD